MKVGDQVVDKRTQVLYNVRYEDDKYFYLARPDMSEVLKVKHERALLDYEYTGGGDT